MIEPALWAWSKSFQFTATPLHPGLHIAVKGGLRMIARDQKPFWPVEKTCTEKIGAHKGPKAVPDTADEIKPAARREQHVCAGARVTIDFRQSIFQAGDG